MSYFESKETGISNMSLAKVGVISLADELNTQLLGITFRATILESKRFCTVNISIR